MTRRVRRLVVALGLLAPAPFLTPSIADDESASRIVVEAEGIGPIPGARLLVSFPSSPSGVPTGLTLDGESRFSPANVHKRIEREWESAEFSVSGSGLPFMTARRPCLDETVGVSESDPDWGLVRRGTSRLAVVQAREVRGLRRWQIVWFKSTVVGSLRFVKRGQTQASRVELIDSWTCERYASRPDGSVFVVFGPERPPGHDFVACVEGCAPVRVSSEQIAHADVTAGVRQLSLTVREAEPLTGRLLGVTEEDLRGARVEGWAWETATGALVGRAELGEGGGFRFAGLSTTRCRIAFQILRGNTATRGTWDGSVSPGGASLAMLPCAESFDSDTRVPGARMASDDGARWEMYRAGDAAGRRRAIAVTPDATYVAPGRYVAVAETGGASDVRREFIVEDGLVTVIRP